MRDWIENSVAIGQDFASGEVQICDHGKTELMQIDSVCVESMSPGYETKVQLGSSQRRWTFQSRQRSWTSATLKSSGEGS
jgi:hypothetical protein